jgi:hypothetical protein
MSLLWMVTSVILVVLGVSLATQAHCASGLNLPQELQRPAEARIGLREAGH